MRSAERCDDTFQFIFSLSQGAESVSALLSLLTFSPPQEQETNFAEVFFLNMLRHPNIVAYYNSFVLPEEIWVAMEFLQGGTLSDACKVRQFHEEEVAFVARELLQGVKYMHDNGFAHRDIK